MESIQIQLFIWRRRRRKTNKWLKALKKRTHLNRFHEFNFVHFSPPLNWYMIFLHNPWNEFLCEHTNQYHVCYQIYTLATQKNNKIEINEKVDRKTIDIKPKKKQISLMKNRQITKRKQQYADENETKQLKRYSPKFQWRTFFHNLSKNKGSHLIWHKNRFKQIRLKEIETTV